jgi:localization factor PodJL
MSKENASSADHASGRPTIVSGGQSLAAIENWLQRAIADLVGRGADDETPIDLTEGLKAMAALLLESVHPRQALHAAARGLPGSAGSTGAQETLRAEIAEPADLEGGGETLAYVSLLDPRGVLDRVGGQPRAGGAESLSLALTDLEAELGRRAPCAEPETTSAARAAELAPHGADAGIDSVASPDALTNLIESTRRRLIDTFETGLAAAATETRALKGAVQSLAEKIEAPRETAARDNAIKALERDVATIAGHLAGADKGFAALANFEQSIGRLVEQIEQTRKQIADEAKAVRGRASGKHEGRAARETAELRAARDEADNRIHLALSAVHETLRDVDHPLAGLATNPGPMRPNRAIPAPPPERRPRSDREPPTPGPASPRRSLHAGEREATGEAPGAEIDDFLIEPGARFPPRAPRPRSPARPYAGRVAGDPAQAKSIRGDADSEAQPRANAGGRRPAGKPPDRANGGFFGAQRKAIRLAVAALTVALGACALTCFAAVRGFEPPRFLKSIGLRAAPLEWRSVVVDGRYPTADVGRDSTKDAHENLRGPPDPPRIAFGLVDPAALRAPRNIPPSIPIAQATRPIAGGAAILPGEFTGRAHPVRQPRS